MARIDKLLGALVQTGGSDLHMSVGVPPIFRINGRLKRLRSEVMSATQVEELLREIVPEKLWDQFETEMDLDFAYEVDGLGRFRVNAFIQKNGMSGVFRVVPTDIPSPDEINMPQIVRSLALTHKGLVLVTGATGSGKSTTLASLVDLINVNRSSHIITIEDPIEFVHESKKSLVSQREVGQHTLSFTRALRSALREDPDVILVGELRDIETMSLAVTAAETGHLVLGTLHTMSAVKTIDRIIDSFSSDQQEQIRIQLSEALKAIVAQQLLPRSDGQGRIAAFEILLNNNAVANLVREKKTHQIQSTIQSHRKQGMQLMDASLTELVKKGVVSPEEALSRANDRDYMESEFKKQGVQGMK